MDNSPPFSLLAFLLGGGKMRVLIINNKNMSFEQPETDPNPQTAESTPKPKMELGRELNLKSLDISGEKSDEIYILMDRFI